MTSARGPLWIVAIVAVTVVCAPVAHADEPTARPWAAGVSQADQDRGFELFAKGNELFFKDQFAAALPLYRQAIAIYDHPAIRYNIALALINLDRLIEASEELDRALRFDGQALEPDLREQARSYQRLLRSQIVHLTIDCADAGALITLDGKQLDLHCPVAASELLLPGPHQIVASKPGHLRRAIDLSPPGGTTSYQKIKLLSIADATVHRRRWARWKPWAVVGGGAAVALVGLGFELQAAATFRSYDRAVATLCPDQPCSSLPAVVADAYDEGRRENHIALGLFGVAGATAATGAVLLWLNRSIPELVGYDKAPVVTSSVVGGRWTIDARVAF